jgi:hypothetical protein
MKNIEMLSSWRYTTSMLNPRVSDDGLNDHTARSTASPSPDSDSGQCVRLRASSSGEMATGPGIIGFARSRSRLIAPTRLGDCVVLPWEFQT